MIEQRGEPIPGSKLVRDFCVLCDEPIRVFNVGHHYCTDCQKLDKTGPLPTVGGNPHPAFPRSEMHFHGGLNTGEW